jgi:hypothetical protein
VEYAIPDDFCGLGLAEEKYEPLFPPGKEIKYRFAEHDGGGMTCRAVIDRASQLLITAEFFSGVHDIDEPTYTHPNPSAHPRTVEGEYESRVWPGFARALILCEDSGTTRPFNISVSADYPSDPEESEEILAELIQPLAEALSSHCPEGTSAAAG